MVIVLSFLKDIELFGSEGVGLMVGDWVVRGGGYDDVIEEVYSQKFCSFTYFGRDFGRELMGDLQGEIEG